MIHPLWKKIFILKYCISQGWKCSKLSRCESISISISISMESIKMESVTFFVVLNSLNNNTLRLIFFTLLLNNEYFREEQRDKFSLYNPMSISELARWIQTWPLDLFFLPQFQPKHTMAGIYQHLSRSEQCSGAQLFTLFAVKKDSFEICFVSICRVQRYI